MLKKLAISLFLIIIPIASALNLQATQVEISEGNLTEIGNINISTNFGMIYGTINFKLENFVWAAKEIWLLPQKVDPEIFSKGLKQIEILELPENLTFSTCRTAVYFNESIGYGFKIYNTKTKIQILENGTFCGLAYAGNYYVYAAY